MNMPRKVIRLKFNSDYDFLLAGVVTGMKDFRLCFEINRVLEINFIRQDDISLSAGKPGSGTKHSYFRSPGADSEMYHLISNRDSNLTGFFIPEMRNVDYFLLVTDTYGMFDLHEMITKVKSINQVSGVYLLEPSKIKSADAFLLVVE